MQRDPVRSGKTIANCILACDFEALNRHRRTQQIRTTDGIQTGVEGLGRAIERAGVIEEEDYQNLIKSSRKGWDNNTTESVPRLIVILLL